MRNGRFGLIEIKSGGDKLIEEGAKSLKAMDAKIDTDKMNAQSFLMVLTEREILRTADPTAFRLPGVLIIV